MRKAITLGLALALCLALAVPAAAYVVTDQADFGGYFLNPDPETERFWEQYEEQLNQQDIYRMPWSSWYTATDFHDGLLLVQNSNEADEYANYDLYHYHNYVDKNGRPHNLNRKRYNVMGSFLNGYAPVCPTDYSYSAYANQNNLDAYEANRYAPRPGVGYIDTQGNEVIPVHNDWYMLDVNDFSFGYFFGRFENGRALVIRPPQTVKLPEGATFTTTFLYDLDNGVTVKGYEWGGLEYAYINTSGNYLTGWTYTRDFDALLQLPLYDECGVSLAEHYRCEHFYWDTKESEPAGTPYPTIHISLELEPDEVSDGGHLRYTITNTTGTDINRCYALLSYWQTTSYTPAGALTPFGGREETEHEYFYGELLPLKLDLKKGESVSGKVYLAPGGWSTQTHRWIEFESEAEMNEFLSHPAIGSAGFSGLDPIRSIDSGKAGVAFMKDVLGITIQSGKNAEGRAVRAH